MNDKDTYRMHTKVIQIGDRKIGGGNPIAIQSMTNTRTDDLESTLSQIRSLAAAGCQIVRVAVPDRAAARAVAEALGAQKLVFLTDVGGILIDSHNTKTAVPHMDVKRALELMDAGLIAGGMAPKVRGCVHAIQSGEGQVSILDGRVEHALLLDTLGQRVEGTVITG